MKDLEHLRLLVDDLSRSDDTSVHLETLLTALYLERLKSEHGQKIKKREGERPDGNKKLKEIAEICEDLPSRWRLTRVIADATKSRIMDAKKIVDLLESLFDNPGRYLSELAAQKTRKRLEKGWPRTSLSLPTSWRKREVVARLETRGLVGTQLFPWKAVFDLGLCWDPIEQLPYYPGSTIKGAVHGLLFKPDLVIDAVKRALKDNRLDKAAALAKVVVALGVSDWRNDVERLLTGYGEKEEFLRKLREAAATELRAKGVEVPVDKVTGTPLLEKVSWRGYVVFFDAYPRSASKNGWLLVPEVMTPHYREESKDDKTMFAEHLAKPTPLIFLAVEAGTEFVFPIAARDDEALKICEELLKVVLREVGLGAKTTSGYNLFRIDKDY